MVAPAAMLLFWPVRQRVSDALYHRGVVWPASVLIALIGAYWAFERVFLG